MEAKVRMPTRRILDLVTIVVRCLMRAATTAFVVAVLLGGAMPAFAWIDAAWPYRRAIEIDWIAERATGDEIVMADFYTGGAHLPDAADVRVATPNDMLLPSEVLLAEPGDRVRVAFRPVRGVSRYYVYFGNPRPPAPPPERTTVAPTAGLTMEMRELTTDAVNNFAEIGKAWESAGKRIGRTLIDRAALGVNPFGQQQRTISRLEGVFPVGFDGEYQFALSADDRAAMFIDGQPVVYSAAAFADVRNHATIALKQGKRKFVLYHVNLESDGRFAVAFRRAESAKWQPLGPEVLGKPLRGVDGPLEQQGKPYAADFAVGYQGECFFADGYSHRYQFTAHPPPANTPATFEWDFGNGQTATGPSATQVYLADGEYAVKLTARVGDSSDVRTHRISVHRDWEWADRPTEEPLERHALVVSGYRADRMPAAWMARAALLFVRSDKLGPALAAAANAAVTRDPIQADAAFAAMSEVSAAAFAAGRIGDAVRLWQFVRPDSPMQPRAGRELASLQLWRQGDVPGALQTLSALSKEDADLQRAYGQALVLSGKAGEGRKILESFPVSINPAARMALSGASARNVEFYLTAKDADAGDEAWELWQQRLPADFLPGYAVLLKVRLMELRQHPAAAANVAEAFARAVPESPYSPQLLDRASRLIGESDVARGLSLRKLLKERYPEDPLAQ